MLSPKRVLLVTAVLFSLGNLYVTFARSGIPFELTGTVTEVEVVNEKVPGLDDVWLVHLEDRSIHLDNNTAAQLDDGEALLKPRWSFSIGRPAGEDIPLRPSRDFWGMWPTLSLLVGSLVYLEKKRGARRAPLDPET